MILTGLLAYLSIFDETPNSIGRRGAIGVIKLRRWGRIVPYVIDPKLNSDIVKSAMKVWSDRTGGNFQFVPRTNERDYVEFVLSADGCNAYMGRTNGQNIINLTTGCTNNILDVVHEIGHKVGCLQHEHQRSDRDAFVKINIDNVIPAYQFAFRQTESQNLTPYDFTSAMHYMDTAFTANGRLTIESKVSDRKVPKTKQMLSDYDVWAVCRFYEFDGCKFDNPNILIELGPTVPKTTTTTTTTSSQGPTTTSSTTTEMSTSTPTQTSTEIPTSTPTQTKTEIPTSSPTQTKTDIGPTMTPATSDATSNSAAHHGLPEVIVAAALALLL